MVDLQFTLQVLIKYFNLSIFLITFILNTIYFTSNQEESDFKPPSRSTQPKPVETWRRKSPRRQNDDDSAPRRRVSPERNPRYEEAPPPRENAWERQPVVIKETSPEENVYNGISPST